MKKLFGFVKGRDGQPARLVRVEATDRIPREELRRKLVAISARRQRTYGATQTTVFYGPSKADSAKTLAAAIPGAVLQEDPNLTRTLEVVVGSGYTGAHAVTVTGGTPTATASPGPKLRTAQDDVCA